MRGQPLCGCRCLRTREHVGRPSGHPARHRGRARGRSGHRARAPRWRSPSGPQEDRAPACRTGPATAPRSHRRRRRRRLRPVGRRCTARRRPRPAVTTSAPIHQIPNNTAAVCQCAGNSTATRLDGPAPISSRNRLPVLAAQFTSVAVDNSIRSPRRVVVIRDPRTGRVGGHERIEDCRTDCGHV